MKIRTILLDMDEVIADFVGAACRLYGVDREAMESVRPPGEWSIEPSLSKILGYDVTRDRFWERIHEVGVAFWTGIDALPWMADTIHQIVTTCDRIGAEWHILSAPSDETCSYTGKVEWLKRRFGRKFDQYLLTPHKSLLARPGTLLIDDRERNIQSFVKAGGDGLVFPNKGNLLHPMANDPVSYLKVYLQELR